MPRQVWLQSEALESREMPSCSCITPAPRVCAESCLSPYTVRGWLSNAACSAFLSSVLVPLPLCDAALQTRQQPA